MAMDYYRGVLSLQRFAAYKVAAATDVNLERLVANCLITDKIADQVKFEWERIASYRSEREWYDSLDAHQRNEGTWAIMKIKQMIARYDERWYIANDTAIPDVVGWNENRYIRRGVKETNKLLRKTLKKLNRMVYVSPRVCYDKGVFHRHNGFDGSGNMVTWNPYSNERQQKVDDWWRMFEFYKEKGYNTDSLMKKTPRS